MKKIVNTTSQTIFDLIKKEKKRILTSINLIASENYVSNNIMKAQGSILTNKYAEGYPKQRYYAGCENIDKIEEITIKKLQQLFGAKYANVQPHSGSQANLSVFLSVLQKKDTILSMSLDSGGHLSHGAKANISGKWFNCIQYTVNHESFLIDYNQIEWLAKKYKPKLIIAGYSSYSRKISFKF